MSLFLAVIAALSQAAVPPPGPTAGEVPATTAAPTMNDGEQAQAPPRRVKMTCNTGPLHKVAGGQPWTFYSCSDDVTLIVIPSEGNPAAPFLFFLMPSKGAYTYASLPSKVPVAAQAALNELLALSPEAMAGLIAQTKGQSAGAGAAPVEVQASQLQKEYEEERIGAWSLRTDRRARTFGVVLMETGVIELAARSKDGRVEFVLRDNGAILNVWVNTPNCGHSMHPGRYPGSRGKPTIWDFAAEAVSTAGCDLGAYRPEVLGWMQEFPRAIEAMESRARLIFGPNINRCVPPRYRPGRETPHPPCGFPPPAIGERNPS